MGGLNSGRKSKRKKITVTFTAYPEDLVRWHAKAKIKQWSLSQLLYSMVSAGELEGDKAVMASVSAKKESGR